MRKPWRTTAWSSTNKIFVFLLILFHGQRHPGFDSDAGALRADFQFPTGVPRAGAHAGHSDSAAGRGYGGIDALSIVADPETHLVAILVKADFDAGGLGVAGDVGERFLGDAEEMGFGFVGEADREGRVISDFDAGAFVEAFALPAEAGVETEVVKDGGAKELGEFADVFDGLVDQLQAVVDAAIGGRGGEGGEVGLDGGEGLAEFVVEFVGEAAGGRFLVFEHMPGDAAELAGLPFQAAGEAGGGADGEDGHD